MRELTCLRVTLGSHSVLSTTLACSTCLLLGHWLCKRRRASSGLTPSRSVILVTAWREEEKNQIRKKPTGGEIKQSDVWLDSSRTSAPFLASNGVRQGGILSPVLFNLDMDDLSRQLNQCGTGCMVSADDLVIMPPSSVGVQSLLSCGVQFKILINSKKSVNFIVNAANSTACTSQHAS